MAEQRSWHCYGCYSTSPANAGVPINFTRWRTYDPRVRPWYTSASSAWATTTLQLGYSPVYAFASSGELGITATGVIMSDGTFLGVYGLDCELRLSLDRLSSLQSISHRLNENFSL